MGESEASTHVQTSPSDVLYDLYVVYGFHNEYHGVRSGQTFFDWNPKIQIAIGLQNPIWIN